MTPDARKLALRIVRGAFGIAGIVFIVLTFFHTWNRSRAVVSPAVWRLVLAGVLMMLGPLFSGIGWSRLFARRIDGALVRAFLVSQPAKYIPGGAWQVVGQVGLSHQSGIGLDRVVAAFPIWIAIQVAASGIVGASLALFGSGAATPTRLLSLAGLLPIVFLHRAWLVRISDAYMRWRKQAARPDIVPAQAAIIGAWIWTLLTVLATGTAFAVLLRGLHGAGFGVAIPVFALAWIVGFLALPVPGGFGVREGTMLALAGASGGATIAASVLQRLLTIGTELVLVLIFYRTRRAAQTEEAAR
ncbi:MAG: hypothetical protein ABR548_11885 [Actinomycetota bacterium]|nr:hypothetical protein [Actinomycetota bacterium]